MEEWAFPHALWDNFAFDWILICQAIARGLTILTPDENIANYPVLTTW
jgi:PIN domain nuclease of toxin-antitoxin system